MRFKYEWLNSVQGASQSPSDRTHRLTFLEVYGDPEAPRDSANTAAITLVLTADEAAAYVLGGEYEINVAPAV